MPSSSPTPWKASIVFIYSSWDLSKYFHAEAVHANTFNQYYHKIMTHSSQLTNQIHSNVLHEDAVSKWWSMNWNTFTIHIFAFILGRFVFSIGIFVVFGINSADNRMGDQKSFDIFMFLSICQFIFGPNGVETKLLYRTVCSFVCGISHHTIQCYILHINLFGSIEYRQTLFSTHSFFLCSISMLKYASLSCKCL